MFSIIAYYSMICAPMLTIACDESPQKENFHTKLQTRLREIDATSLPDWKLDNAADNPWMETIGKAEQVITSAFNAKDSRKAIMSLVNLFGQDSANTDLVLMLGLGRYGVPSHSGNAGLVIAGPPGNGQGDLYRSRQLLVAECFVYVFLERPEAIERYLHFLIWAELINKRSYIHFKKNAADSLASADYWWHARNLIILRAMSGWRSFKEQPASLAPELNQWMKSSSFEAEKLFELSFSSPFPDWNGKNVISPRVWRSFFDWVPDSN